MPNRTLTNLAFCLAFSCFSSAAIAQQTNAQTGGFQTDPNAPVEVVADRLDLDQANGTANFQGGVIVTQGEMKLTAEEIQVVYMRLADGSVGSDVDTITALGNVLVVTPAEAAEAQKAVFTPSRNEVIMTGEVLLTQGGNTLAGQKLTIDLETGVGQVEGRVRTVLQPGNDAQ